MICKMCRHEFHDGRERCPVCGTRVNRPAQRVHRTHDCAACDAPQANIVCPSCDRPVHKRCLYGHLRVHHDLSPADARTTYKKRRYV